MPYFAARSTPFGRQSRALRPRRRFRDEALTIATFSVRVGRRASGVGRRASVAVGSELAGGEGEIRTHEPRKGPPVFKTGAFNRSATSPRRQNRAFASFLILPYNIHTCCKTTRGKRICRSEGRVTGVGRTFLAAPEPA